MIRLIILQGWYRTKESHLVYSGILHAIFPNAKIVSSLPDIDIRTFYIFGKDERTIPELNDILCKAIQASGIHEAHLIFETGKMCGCSSNNIFGYEVSEKFNEFYKESLLFDCSKLFLVCRLL